MHTNLQIYKFTNFQICNAAKKTFFWQKSDKTDSHLSNIIWTMVRSKAFNMCVKIFKGIFA